MIAEERDRVNVLLALLRNVHSELVRYRDKEWQITAYVVTLELTFVGGWPFGRPLIRSGLWSLMFASVFLVTVGVVGVYFLGYVHKRLNAARVTYNTILFRLGLDEIAVEGPGSDGFQFSSDRGPGSDLLRPRSRRQLGFSEGRGVEFILSFMTLIILVTLFSVFIVLSKRDALMDLL